MAKSPDVGERKTAVKQLLDNFASIFDKDTAWRNLLRLAEDEDLIVQMRAAYALGEAFPHVHDRNAAWEDLHRLTKGKNKDVQKAAVRALSIAFPHVHDKKEAWTVLHRLTEDEDKNVRGEAAFALKSTFPHILDKEAAWEDLHRLTEDEISEVRSHAISALCLIFSHIPDKVAAWEDLHRLRGDEDIKVQAHAACALGSAFFYVPDKNAAWDDLHKFRKDDDKYIREKTACALGSAFPHILDKNEAWNDLHSLTKDEDENVRMKAAYAFGSAFPHIPDKKEAWNDLHRLTEEEDVNVRMQAAYAFGSAFPHIPDKKGAWNDLHRLTEEEDENVRMQAASALGSAFPYVLDKKEIWDDLHRLIEDENKNVRMYAYHSLGSAYVCKATETEDEGKLKDELKQAIDYFEKSSQEAVYKLVNPARFCLPFYRSYYAIISEMHEAEAEAEVAKYLEEAKEATDNSESKERLLDAVNNLANALKEAHKAQDFGEMKNDLNIYRQYCDRTAELMDCTSQKAPLATEMIMRGLPIVGRKIKAIITEIQEKAKEACRQAQGTPTEDIACAVNQEVQKWRIDDQEEMTRNIEKLILTLKSKIPQIPQNEHICEKIEKLRDEHDMAKQYGIVPLIIALIPNTTVHIGDNVTISDVTVGDNSQIIGKGDENKNASENVLAIAPESPKKTWMTRINTPVTFGGFIGFVIGGIGTYFYPTQSISLIGIISVGVAVFAAIIFSIFSKE